MNRGGGPGRRIPGAAGDGVIEGGYLDAVKLTAHSCPTFAGAYRMTLTAMARLYPDAISAYGHLPMRVRQRLDEGVARVADLITGAANKGWIQGLGSPVTAGATCGNLVC